MRAQSPNGVDADGRASRDGLVAAGAPAGRPRPASPSTWASSDELATGQPVGAEDTATGGAWRRVRRRRGRRSGCHPASVRNGCAAVVRTTRPSRVVTRYTGLTPSSTNADG